MSRKYVMKEVENPKTYLSWGKGLQSTCLGVLSTLGVLPKVDGIISADTQWEHSYTDEIEKFYTTWFIDKGVPVYKTTAGNIQEMPFGRLDIPFFTDKTGAPLRRQCTSMYKIIPIRRKIRELIGVNATGKGRTRKGLVKLWLGITTDEAERMADSSVNYITNEYPLVDIGMSRTDCIRVFKDLNLPVPRKSSCVCCPYQGAESWLDLKTNFPIEWNQAVEFDEKFRNSPEEMKLRGYECKLYLWKKLTPLKDTDFAAIVDKKDNKDVCDSGYCFV